MKKPPLTPDEVNDLLEAVFYYMKEVSKVATGIGAKAHVIFEEEYKKYEKLADKVFMLGREKGD